MKSRKKLGLSMLVVIMLFTISNLSSAETSDFSDLSWVDAFNKLHQRIAQEYAFTEWKVINWQKLYDNYLDKIARAQLNNSFEEYYIQLRNYLHEIPDGHVGISTLREIDDKYIGGGFGLAIAKIADGRIIVTWVDEASLAFKAGIRVGTELIEWDGQLVTVAIDAVATTFDSISATKENLESKKLQNLTRAPIGKQVNIIFCNQDSSELHSITLTAYDDNRMSLTKNYPDIVISDKLRDLILDIENSNPMPEAMVETAILNGNVGYIKIWGEFDADLQLTGKTTSTLELFRQAIKEAIAENVSGIIVDLRNNLGGLDDMAADILGSFYSEKTFYEYQNIYNATTGEREILPAKPNSDSLALYIEPAEVIYKGRVIALINTKCVSSGEGIAMGIRNIPNGDTLGFYGTNGSFGLAGEEALMPGELLVRWPSGQSLDKNKTIQLDSRDGVGGVSPTIKISMSFENALRLANGEDVELAEALRILSINK